MARYFFNIVRPDKSVVCDDEGEEFEDFEGAKVEAIASIRDLAAECVKHGSRVYDLAIQVVNESGDVVETITAQQNFT